MPEPLQGPVVGTVMSNLGLEVALREQGIEFRRAAVGDRYVLGMLRESGGSVGGETSGHILLLDKTTTGDALMAGLQVLAVMRETEQGLAELAAGMPRFPQTMINVKVARRFDPTSVPGSAKTRCRGWRCAWAETAAWSCGPRAPNR